MGTCADQIAHILAAYVHRNVLCTLLDLFMCISLPMCIGQKYRDTYSDIHWDTYTKGGAPDLSGYTAAAIWNPVWGAWPPSAGSQTACLPPTTTAFTNPVDISRLTSPKSGKSTMFTQCCSTKTGIPSARDCSTSEGKSWSEAKDLCNAKLPAGDYRLCTASELGSAFAKGCDLDGIDNRAWSSDTCIEQSYTPLPMYDTTPAQDTMCMTAPLYN